MIEIGLRDRIFVMVALPFAALGAYIHFFAMPTLGKSKELEGRRAALVEIADFPAKRALVDARISKASAALEEAKSLGPVAAEVEGNPSLGESERQRALFASLAAKRLRVVRSTPETKDGAVAQSALKSTGAVDSPVRLRLLLEGSYPDLLSALESFAADRAAVIPESIRFSMNVRNRWEVSLWL